MNGPAARYARLVHHLRIPIVIAWLVAGWYAAQQPPASTSRGGASLRELAPVTLPAVQAELRSATAFPVPLHSRTVSVHHDPSGIPRATQQAIAEQAAPRSVRDARWPDVVGGIPLVNQPPLAGSRAPASTTMVTYLVFDPDTSATARTRQARRYAAELPTQTGASGVTGAVPARVATADAILGALPRLETVTALVIAVAVLLFYRSLVAPVIVLASILLAYVVSQATLGALARQLGRDVPREVEPLLVALLLGVVTDYCIFYLSSLRRHSLEGMRGPDAARRASADSVPLVVVASLTVAAGCVSLLLARTDFLQAFGPALAITVLVAAGVSITFVPAVLSLLGTGALWPMPGRRAPRPTRLRPMARVLHRRATAIVPVALVLVALAVSSGPLAQVRLGYDAISGLPDQDPARAAQLLAERGFAPGVVAPTIVLLEGRGLDRALPELVELQRSLDDEPGVAGTFGVASVTAVRELAPMTGELPALRDPLGLAVSPDGRSARMLVVLDDEPYGGRAVQSLEHLRGRLPALARQAGIGSRVTVSVAGDTAVVLELLDELRDDLLRIALGVVVLDLVLIAAFLRSLLAPVVVVGGSVLAVTASLGATTWLFQDVLDMDGIAFYVPVATLVLLLSLGADYGVYSVGHTWQLARTRPLRQALVEGSAQTSRVVAIAGTLLGASFALLAVVPVDAFLQFAFAMSFGVLLDTFVIRPVLLPCSLRVIGPAVFWPARGRGGPADAAAAERTVSARAGS